MATMTDDSPAMTAPAGTAKTPVGFALALGSAVSFGASGALARGLFESGWNAGGLVLIRISLAALVLLPFGLRALDGRWSILRENWKLILTYGVLAVAGAQFCYFSAVGYMEVGPALLIEYTAPAAVVVWLWVRHAQRPSALTLLGAGLAAIGLILVLDLISGAQVSVPGVLWALAAMVGATSYFLISADADNGLPPITLAACGLVVGGLMLAVLGLVGALPMQAATRAATYAGHTVPWWLPVLALALVTAALAYVLGIAAIRVLGSRLASFVALTEVLAGVGFAWLLLDELPRTIQLIGGALVLAGVVAVKLGEARVATAAT